jgi:uncharacterized cupredoxin-like copper-binding protein
MRAALAILCLLLTASCAETLTGRAQPAAAPGQPQRVAIEASNYEFAPNEIAVKVDQPVEVTVKNVSEGDHNITIKNPRGEIIAEADLPPGSSRTVSFTASERGRYEFYCNKFGHSVLGMRGEFMAGGG